MKKYYFGNFLVRKSNNEYTHAVACIVNEKLKVYGCHSNYQLAIKRFNETKADLERVYKSWENVSEEDKKIFTPEECERNAKKYKYIFDNLMLIKLEVK